MCCVPVERSRRLMYVVKVEEEDRCCSMPCVGDFSFKLLVPTHTENILTHYMGWRDHLYSMRCGDLWSGL